MPITTTGFAGSIDDVTYSVMESDRGPRFVVSQFAHWQPTVTSADRTVQLTAGWATQLGLRHTLAAAETYQTTANTSGQDRFDVLVARCVFGSPSSAVIAWKQGTPSAGVPPALVRAGGTYESPICVLRVTNGMGAAPGANLVDTRLWGGVGGAPLRYPAGSAHLELHDLHRGAEILTESTTPGGSIRYRVDDTGTLRPTGMYAVAVQAGEAASVAPGASAGTWYRWATDFPSITLPVRAGDQILATIGGEMRAHSGSASMAAVLSGVTVGNAWNSNFNNAFKVYNPGSTGVYIGDSREKLWQITQTGTATIAPWRQVDHGATVGSWTGVELFARVIRA